MTLLRQSLIRITIPVVIVFCIGIGIIQTGVRQYAMNQSLNLFDQKLLACKQEVGRILERPENMLLALASVVGESDLTPRELQDQFDTYSTLYTDTQGFYGVLNGTYFDGTGWEPEPGWDPTRRPWYTVATAVPGGTAYTDTYTDSMSRATIVSLARVVRNERNQNVGVVALDYPLTQIAVALEKIKENLDERVFIITGSGQFVAGEQLSGDIRSSIYRDIADRLLRDFDGYEEMELGGTRYFFKASGLDATGWRLVFAEPYEEVAEFAIFLTRILIIASVILFIILVYLIVGRMRRISRPITATAATLNDIASGEADLTQRVTLRTHAIEINRVVDAFNAFINSLQKIIGNVKVSDEQLTRVTHEMSSTLEDSKRLIADITGSINAASTQMQKQASDVEEAASVVNEVSGNIERLADMSQTASSSVTEAVTAVEQMVGNIDAVTTSVDQMALSFGSLNDSAKVGITKQQAVNERIEQISTQSDMLQEANTAIASIAEQTNLLAMNAAIEAAHAGEAGKGFSVVADEIRKLSETSSSQSKTIGDQLNKIKESIGEVVATSKESTRTFSDMAQKIQSTDTLVQQIKAAMTEQKEGSRQIIDSLHTMGSNTVAVRDSSQSLSASNQRILAEVTRLQESTRTMVESVSGMKQSAASITSNGQALADISTKVKDSVQNISASVNAFKV